MNGDRLILSMTAVCNGRALLLGEGRVSVELILTALDALLLIYC